MKSLDGRTTKPVRRRLCAGTATMMVLLTLVAVAAAGCGGSGGSPAAGGAPSSSIQVLATARRGDIVQSAMGVARIVVSNGKKTVLATIPKQFAATVATGQAATVFFVRFPASGQNGQSAAPFPQSGQSGAPVPQNGQSGAPFPQGGQGGFGGDFGAGGLRGGTAGTVTAVQRNADGSAAVTIAVKKSPSSVTLKSVGFARIQTKVLAANAVIIPTAAIKGSGASATVQVLSGGKTGARSIVVGQQAGGESEVVSGLTAGENVVYTRSFRRGGFFPNGGAPMPGQSGAPFGGQQSGQSGTTTSGGGSL